MNLVDEISSKEVSQCAIDSVNCRSSSISTTCDLQVIHQDIPAGIEVKQAKYGHGVFATQFFAKGSTVYVGRQLVIPNEYAEFKLIINPTGQTFMLNTETHSVEFSETHRWLYLFDSFMNHCCDPTTISRQTEVQRANNEYETVALMDIEAGDQITCDYNLFEYDCHGKEIDQCLCGSAKCIGRIAGFKYLTDLQKMDRLQLVEIEVLEALSIDSTNKFYYIPDLKCPINSVSIVNGAEKGAFKLIANREFAIGDTVYTNESLLFSEEANIVIEIDGCRKWLDKLIHTVNRGDGIREFFYFDSFQNHSCDPNTVMIYSSDSVYSVIATNPIKIGDDITSDYESFDVGLDGTSFECSCGSDKCRGIVKA